VGKEAKGGLEELLSIQPKTQEELKRIEDEARQYLKWNEVAVYNEYTKKLEIVRLNPLKLIGYKIKGIVKIDYRLYPGWTGKIPFYLFRIDRKGPDFIDYPHGYCDRLDAYL